MKRILLFLLLVICLGCNNDLSVDNKTTTTKPIVNEINHMVLETANEVRTIMHSKETKMLVFGRESSDWCQRYVEVINRVSKDHNIIIYYLDLDNLIDFEMSALFALNIMIPGKCTANNKETNLISTMPTPISLFFKDNKTIDCISGFVPTRDLIEYLKEHEMIE